MISFNCNLMTNRQHGESQIGPLTDGRRRNPDNSVVCTVEAFNWRRAMAEKNHEQETAVQYGQLAGDLRSYVRSKLNGIKRGHDIEVEDVVQETFLRVWATKNPDCIKNGKGYLFRTAKNLIIDIGRRRTIQPVDAESSRSGANVALTLATSNLTPERSVCAKQELDIVLNAIDKLPEKCRNAFCLQRSTGKTYASVAAELNMSESMVQKHMARALHELNKVLP